ncbi:MAG: LamG domain-containing protein [Clostridia bacterium]|nr:LamG domain-containing protein [Clostridia bacterium]
MNIKNVFKKIVSFTAALVLAVGLLPSFPSHAENLYESAYDFDDVSNLKWDLSGQHSLIEYSFSPFWAESGRHGLGVASFCSLPYEMFSDLENLTFALHIKPSENQTYGKKLLFAGTGSYTDPYISLELSPEGEYCVNIYDGNSTATVSFVAKDTEWVHIAFVFSEYAFTLSNLALYYNGIKMSETTTSVDLSAITGRLVYMDDLHIDNLYISNKVLDDTQINLLSTMSVRDYFEMNGLEIVETQPDSGWIDSDEPIFPKVLITLLSLMILTILLSPYYREIGFSLRDLCLQSIPGLHIILMGLLIQQRT